MALPTAGQKPLRTASSKASKKTRYNGRARHKRVDLDVLVQRMRAVTDGAETVERRHAESRGEVAVGSAPGTSLLQCDADLRRDAPRHLEYLDDGRRAFERRPLEAAADFDFRAGDVGPGGF